MDAFKSPERGGRGKPSRLSDSCLDGPLFRAQRSSLVGCYEGVDSPFANESILKNFKFYQDLNTGIQQKLPSISQRQRYPRGTVLFQQGDPPGSCYVVITGEVVVFFRSSEDAASSQKLDAATLQRLPAAEDARTEEVSSHATVKKPTPTEEEDGLSDFGVDDEEYCGVLETAEGFSTYKGDADFGSLVATLGAGHIFGELALIEDQMRMATVKCTEDIEVLVIKKVDFDQVWKEEMKRSAEEMVCFLETHVPGMVEVPAARGRPHHSYFFQKATFHKGHCFLHQGSIYDETIFVVSQGAVEFSRREPKQHQFLTSVNGSHAQVRSNSCTANARTSSHRRRLQVTSSPGDVADRPGSAEVENPCASQAGQGAARMLGMLLRGGVFGSLPLPGPEPFTVVAASINTEVMILSSESLPKLPRKLLDILREYLARSATLRLGRLLEHRSIEERWHHDAQVRWKRERAMGGANALRVEDVPKLKGKVHYSNKMSELVNQREHQQAQERVLASRNKLLEQMGATGERLKEEHTHGSRIERSTTPSSVMSFCTTSIASTSSSPSAASVSTSGRGAAVGRVRGRLGNSIGPGKMAPTAWPVVPPLNGAGGSRSLGGLPTISAADEDMRPATAPATTGFSLDANGPIDQRRGQQLRPLKNAKKQRREGRSMNLQALGG